jgi:NTE family protein
VGAINAAYIAASLHLGAERALAQGLARWRQATKRKVIRPILLQQAPLTVLRYAGEVLSLPGVRLPSLLDPTPLERNLHRWIDWPALHRNVADGIVDAVGVVATAARSGRSVVFVEAAGELETHESHVVEYVATELAGEHVRASAAIPLLFPPVRIERPAACRGWYVDGGTRLNTPIKPALDLGADRLVVIATDAIAEPSGAHGRHECEPPDFGDGALHLLKGALHDSLIEDLRMLGNINLYFTDPAQAPAALEYRAVRGKPPYRRVPYIFVAPERPGAIGELAIEVFHRRYAGLKGLRSPDIPLLNRLLGGDSPTHGELLSYLLFDREFIDALIEMGQRDAWRALKSAPEERGPWIIEPLPAFMRTAA